MYGVAVEVDTSSVGLGIVFEIDDELLASFLRPRHLEQLEASHQGVASLEKAREALPAVGERQRKAGLPVVLLLDLMFPEDYSVEAGIDFIRDVRNGNLGVDFRTPIVVLSNARSPEVTSKAFKAGANAFFAKTDDETNILKQLAFYLGKAVLEKRQSCEVAEVDYVMNEVRIRVRAGDRWILERLIPMDFCPPEARVHGAAFYWDTYRAFRNLEPKYIATTTAIEDDGGEALEKLLNPDDF